MAVTTNLGARDSLANHCILTGHHLRCAPRPERRLEHAPGCIAVHVCTENVYPLRVWLSVTVTAVSVLTKGVYRWAFLFLAHAEAI